MPPTREPDQTDVDDPFHTVAGENLSDSERRYASKALAANTLRGYRSDWAEFTAWCAGQDLAAPG